MMECPFCGKAMEKGNIYARKDLGIPWIPETAKHPIIWTEKRIADRKGIQLCEPALLPVMGPKQTVFICRSCRKGIIDY